MPWRSDVKSATIFSRTSTTPSVRTMMSDRNDSMRQSAWADDAAGSRQRTAAAMAARMRRISAEVVHAVLVMLVERAAVPDLALGIRQEIPIRVGLRPDGGDDRREARVADRPRREAAVL